jgi:hypothetical protein
LFNAYFDVVFVCENCFLEGDLCPVGGGETRKFFGGHASAQTHWIDAIVFGAY